MLKEVLEKQYNKTLYILQGTIRDYNEDLWYNDKKYTNPVWQVVYHTLFEANAYCSATENGIIKWPKEKINHHFLGKLPWPPFEKVIIESSYSKKEMLELLEFVRNNIPSYLNDMKPEEKCWPDWYDENQLEFHINNIRHIQHHAGEIIERHDIFSGGGFRYEWQ